MGGMWCQAAQAQAGGTGAPRVVLESVRGPSAARVRSVLRRSLTRVAGLVLVEDGEYRDVVIALGHKPGRLRGRALQEVAVSLQAKGFVRAVVRRQGRGWSTTLRVLGARGEVKGRASYGGRSVTAMLRALGAAGRRVERILARPASTAPPAAGRAPAGARGSAVAPSRAATPAPARGNAQPAATPSPAAVGAGGALTQPDAAWYAQDDDEDEDEDDSEGADRSAALPGRDRLEAMAFRLDAGVQRRAMRTMATVFSRYRQPELDPADASTEDEARSYESGGLGHGEIGVRAEIYPGAFGDEPPLPWLGLWGSYHTAVGLQSSGPPCTQDGCGDAVVPIDTSQNEIQIGARARHRFGTHWRDPQLMADIGWGRFSFRLDPDDLAQVDRSTIVPPMVYRYVHLGARLRYGLVPTYLQAEAALGARIGLGVGEDAQQIWGTRTTGGVGLLFGLNLVSEAPYLFEGAFWHLGMEFFQFRTDFRGQTACRQDGCGNAQSNNPDLWEPWPFGGNDPEAVTGGLRDTVQDNYLRLFLGFGYRYR
ncbi:MAG: hypothetical protein ACPGUV_12650 [Polyangiales bacterium]